MFLTKQGKLTKKCPACKQNFIKDKGSACLIACSEKKLEKKHKKILTKLVAYCLPKEKIIIECAFNLSARFAKSKGWGWTNDLAKIITIPWWTLRSKQEFFDTVAHELGHIVAYQKTFSPHLKKVLQNWYNLEMKYELAPSANNYQKLAECILQYEKDIESYLIESEKDNGGHWKVWHHEYQKLFKKLLNSPYAEYAYGNTQPHADGFYELKEI